MVRRTGKPGNAVPGIHIACAMIAVLLAASLAFVLNRSVVEADRFGLTSERKLIHRELQHQIDAVVQYQAELSFWDKTYAQLDEGGFSDAFVAEEVIDWLWQDFGFSWMIFARAGDLPLLTVHDGQAISNGRGASQLKWVADLTDKAMQRHDAQLRAEGNGWKIHVAATDREALTAPIPDIHAADLRMIDGQMSIVVVQAVVPKSLRIPADRKTPVLMVTIKPFTARMLANVEQRLGIDHLAFRPLSWLPEGALHAAAGDCGGADCTVASWMPRAPGDFVRAETLPSVIAISMTGALLMAFISLRFGRVFSALQRSEAENGHMATHDRLTGLLNRSGFDEALGQSLEGVHARPFALLCIDLDQFKAVNDSHGHAAGDAVLKTIAARFLARIGENGSVARLGGDEFAILLHEPVNRADVVAFANALIVDARMPVPFEGQLLLVGSSIGVAFAPDHGSLACDLVPLADRALYRAKNRGRNRVETADDLAPADDAARVERAA